MELSRLRDNPLVAAVLGLLVTGLGHVYLKRWLRAVTWLGLTFAVTAAFVPQSVAEAAVSGTLSDPLAIVPTVLVVVVSAVDAARIARRRSQWRTAEIAMDTDGEEPVETVACPGCGAVVEADLGFCHWCTTEFEVVREGPDPARRE